MTRLRAGLALWLTLAASACSSSAQEERASSNDPTEQESFQLIASGDTHGWIMPCGCTSNQSGGLLRRASYVNRQREASDVVFVDVGGAADGDAPYQRAKFEAILEGERLMGLAAHNLGAAEIAFGASELQRLARDGHYPLISANVRDQQGQPIVDTHRLINVSGQKLLLTGVVSPQSLTSDADVQVSDPADAVFSVLEQSGGYDRLVVLAYLPEEGLRHLAQMLPEANAIIGGPTGQSLQPQLVGRVLLASATNKGKFLVEVTFPQDPSAAASGRVVEMTPDFPDDDLQQKNLDQFRALLTDRDFTAFESGLLDENRWSVSSEQRVAGTTACISCHDETCDEWTRTGHAHAWERLIGEEAHVDSYCQQCHTTGFGWPEGFVSARTTTGRVNVGCESCHGPSQSHVEDSAVPTPFDAQGQCVKCHDVENSPHFAYGPYWEVIQHE